MCGRIDGPTGGQTDRRTDRCSDTSSYRFLSLRHNCKRIFLPSFQTHAPIDLSHYDTIVKGYFCRRSSMGSISQSECSDFGYGPITVAICLATSREIENLPLKVTNRNLNRIMTNVAIAPAFFLHLMSYYCCFCLVRRYPECWYPSCDMEAMISSLLRLTG